jgi:hypothetical protein
MVRIYYILMEDLVKVTVYLYKSQVDNIQSVLEEKLSLSKLFRNYLNDLLGIEKNGSNRICQPNLV